MRNITELQDGLPEGQPEEPPIEIPEGTMEVDFNM
jgi:hypothetical protein